MTFQYQHQQPTTTTTPTEELDNLIDELKNNLLKVRELLIKIEETGKNDGFTIDEIYLMIHEKYVDGLKKKIHDDKKNNNDDNNIMTYPYFQYFK